MITDSHRSLLLRRESRPGFRPPTGRQKPASVPLSGRPWFPSLTLKELDSSKGPRISQMGTDDRIRSVMIRVIRGLCSPRRMEMPGILLPPSPGPSGFLPSVASGRSPHQRPSAFISGSIPSARRAAAPLRENFRSAPGRWNRRWTQMHADRPFRRSEAREGFDSAQIDLSPQRKPPSLSSARGSPSVGIVFPLSDRPWFPSLPSAASGNSPHQRASAVSFLPVRRAVAPSRAKFRSVCFRSILAPVRSPPQAAGNGLTPPRRHVPIRWDHSARSRARASCGRPRRKHGRRTGGRARAARSSARTPRRRR